MVSVTPWKDGPVDAGRSDAQFCVVKSTLSGMETGDALYRLAEANVDISPRQNNRAFQRLVDVSPLRLRFFEILVGSASGAAARNRSTFRQEGERERRRLFCASIQTL
jgi:hypothetical protein